MYGEPSHVTITVARIVQSYSYYALLGYNNGLSEHTASDLSGKN